MKNSVQRICAELNSATIARLLNDISNKIKSFNTKKKSRSPASYTKVLLSVKKRKKNRNYNRNNKKMSKD